MQAPQKDGISKFNQKTTIFTSHKNLNTFRNAALLERIKKFPTLAKCIWGALGLFHCDMMGDLATALGDLLMQKSGYYYSPDGMANILSLEIL